MEDRINKVQSWILIGFIVFYAIALFCNAVMAIFGKAELARNHYIIFPLFAFFAYESLTDEQFAAVKAGVLAVISVSLRLARKVAKTVRCTVKSLRRMPRAFANTYRALISEEA